MTSLTRRHLVLGGGAGVGLVVAWSLWPRRYRGTLVASPGEQIFGAWLKIGIDGHVVVAVPQLEHGQGSYTALAQVVADALGADWRTVGVEAAPLNPVYANPLALDDLFGGGFDAVPADLRTTLAERSALMLTGGSTSIRAFEEPCRRAGAAARVLLCQAAAARWDIAWSDCTVADGFVKHEGKSIRFADLAEDAATRELPDPLPIDGPGAGKLSGRSVPRIDTPSKVDGSANFAGDIRLPDMVHAAIRQAPRRDSRLLSVDRAAADRVRGVLELVENPRWVAAVATTWWAATKALDAARPRFATDGAVVDSASIAAALASAFDRPGTRVAAVGDVEKAFHGADILTADYEVGLGVHAAIETRSATAAYRDGRLEIWMPTAAPGLARSAAARAADLAESDVVIHPMLAGGSFGAALEPIAAEQAAVLAIKLKRPVNLVWSRGEDTRHDRFRPPARARMAARLAANGAILGWRARIAAPATGHELAERLMPRIEAAIMRERYAVAGATPVYRLPALTIDHHVAEIGVPTGHLRGAAHGYTAFFTECFLDELAHIAASEPLSYRIGMLGGEPRLARCLSTAASLGGWDGGVPGSGQGIACHAFRGSYVAVLAEAHIGDDQRPVVDRLVAAVDCGRMINPDLVRQQIEGGLLFGMAQAIGASTGFTGNMAEARGFASLAIPQLDDTPDLTVEIIRSDEAPGGVSEIGVPAVAPAIANALQSATGRRIRTLPLRPG